MTTRSASQASAGDASWLDRPTVDVVADLARGHLSEAAAALARLADRRDSEALHDFRVAVRRLRSLLRGYRRWLGRAAGRKVRRGLGELGSATNAGRDAEVQLEWLEAQRPQLARGERTGLNALVRKLRALRRESYREARGDVRADFARVVERLEQRLGELDATTSVSFRESFSMLLREHAADLEQRLAAIRGAQDDEHAHKARISAKRLRYLLEPIRRDVDGAAALVSRLKDLQDLLGELHDLHVLDDLLLSELKTGAIAKVQLLRSLALAGEEDAVKRQRRRDESRGLVALAAAVRTGRDALFADLSARWLHAAAHSVFADAAALADSLDRRSELPREPEDSSFPQIPPVTTHETPAGDDSAAEIADGPSAGP